MIDLTLQLLLVVLLLLTIAWCVLVHSRLRRLRADRGELQTFIGALAEATARAEETVQHLRDASRAVESSAGERDRQARRQSETLARLTENAERVARRLDSAVEQGATRLAGQRTRGSRSAAAHPDVLPEERGGRLRRSPAADAVLAVDAGEDERKTGRAIRDALSNDEPGIGDPTQAAPKALRNRSLQGPAAASSPGGNDASNARRGSQLDDFLNRELRDALQSLR